ncbi:TlpA disulfide reductase family protein [Chitinophaga cymbidii]|uniref:Thiol:disulfide interchange protein n=1 Tax=Chitinophaga cymbidii TaxID=1096750 RepID=A0A512RQ57_9BACT|nr:TlpA disulfide reductase family protein [Chitinophaga cymbidii]GEP97824.1 thiol:disulfide interchange protein [Chitinophaga cymbidii]
MRKTLLSKSFFTAAVLALAVIFSSFQDKGKYTITGHFSELPDGTVMELVPSGTHKEEKPVASATVKSGRFTFTGSVDGPRYFFVKIADGGYSGFNLMVENAEISVTGKATPAKDGKGRSFTGIQVKGSPSHTAYEEKSSLRGRLNTLYEAYHERGKAVTDELSAARNAKDTARQKEIMASDAWKQFEKEEHAFFKTVGDSITALITANKDTWWGPFLMLTNFSYFTPEQKPLFEQFSKEAKESYYGQVVHADLYPKSYIGQQAPSLTFADVSFASIAKGKKYVVVDFWASWCGPCRKAVPALKAFYAENSKDVEIISVSIDKKDADWMKADKEENFPWHSYLDRQDLADAYQVKAIPAMFLLDAKGIVVAENVTLDQIREKIK